VELPFRVAWLMMGFGDILAVCYEYRLESMGYSILGQQFKNRYLVRNWN